MKGNVYLRPEFAPNPFYFEAGTYTGLLGTAPFETGGTGFLTLTLNNLARFTAKVDLGGQRLTFAGGRLDEDGTFTTAAGDFTLRGALQKTATDYVLTGEVQRVGLPSVSLTARRAAFHARTNPASTYRGRYTILIGPSSTGTVAPVGFGYGTVLVDAAGKVKFAGSLGSGAKVSQTALLSADGVWPLYVTTSRRADLALGLVQFADLPGSDLAGGLAWANAPTTTEDGFAARVDLQGAYFFGVPARPRITRFASGRVGLVGLEPIPGGSSFSIDSAGRIVSGNAAISLQLSPKTGLFSGAYRGANLRQPARFYGAFLQKSDVGAGLFWVGSEVGEVKVEGSSEP